MDALLLTTSHGNEFMLDIARLFQQGLVANGHRATLLLDTVPPDWPADRLTIVVAPHEYVPLFLIPEHPASVDHLLAHSYVLNVEQPGSAWFETAWSYAQQSRGVIDISEEGARACRERGLEAYVAPLGVGPTIEAPDLHAIADRSCDVLFMGHASERRAAFFARHAEFFSSTRSQLVFADLATPRKAGAPGYYSGEERRRLVASAKVLLNVHSSESTYFETHRAVLALANGCLLVTETSRHTAPLVNGVHFAMGPLDELPTLVRSYLADARRLELVSQAGRDFARHECSMEASCSGLVEWVMRQEQERRPAGQPTGSGRSDDDRLRHAVISRLKDARALRQRGEPVADDETNARWAAAATPAVSVIVTLHNYEAFIEPCLQSVFASEPVSGPLEVIVVDDASTDGSVTRARSLMQSAPIAMCLVRKRLNTGLADARNCGLAIARGRAVFTLDADNWIYPSCLRTLEEALVAGSHAAVYGIIRRFSEETGESLGLMSALEWDVPRLVRRPYIDAMALFDRQIILSAGGYSEDLIEHGWFGWEDYDLWLRLARAGHSCRLVPNVLSSYRVHGRSMLRRTNRTSMGLVRHFHKQFGDLVAAYPGMDSYFGHPLTVVDPGGAAHERDPEVLALEHAVTDLQQRLDDMHRSASWRLTAPLRLMYRVLTGRP